MKSYGTVVIQDGIYIKTDPTPTDRERRGFARYSEVVDRPIVPKFTNKSNGLKTFDANVFYNDYKYVYKENRRSYATNIPTEFSKNYKRVASKNVLRDVKNFVSEIAGCCEAHKLRKQIIAIEKIHGTISDITFKFSLGTSTSIRPVGVVISIGSPAIFTSDDHGLTVGSALRFLTSDYLPTGLETKRTYFVSQDNFSSSTFSVSDTYKGSSVDTSGSQSGLHSFMVIT